ncbi:hypothetical protein SAMN00777080_1268 [Aquiflexum balticum DSM 16537]|uniref:YhhN-like protein n=1 Tax=Aquiflexum balticum DSM 16537 TaxID=758820 RepID=A0A1W2H2I6_9BACT|nr:hypothetical protein [Aquiflexum balticum]SMD42706.1 hypothetical protein SAMN00777080_1268 [Aquiflexum balticum DSM 16537]
MQPFFWYNILIVLGMLLSIPYFFIGAQQSKKKHLVIFLILILISLVEVLGKYQQLSGQNNTTIYNVGYVIIGLSLKFYFFSLVFQEKKGKMLVLFLWSAFITWSIINFLFFQSFGVFHHYSFAFGSLILIGLCFFFFHGIFFKNWYMDKNLLAVPEFWIVSFIMFFYSASLLYFISFSFYYEGMDVTFYKRLNFFVNIMGCIMYLIMGLAFYAPLVFKESGK